ncbi:MAG: hypothetical protein ACLUQA_01815 [Faecalibacterium sp.]
MTFQKKAKAGLVCFVTAFLLPFCPLHLENHMTVCMGYPAMTPKWESRKTPPEGGRKSMQGERQNVDFSVAEKNNVVKMTTLFSVTPMKGRNAYE